MKSLMNIGERIKHLREEKNYSQEYIGRKLGISQKAYSKIEAGSTRISVDHLQIIAVTLEISVADILTTEGNMPEGAISKSEQQHTANKIAELYEKLLHAKDQEIAYQKQHIATLLQQINPH